MAFFNDTTSDYVQFISMFFEVIGISLAYIEIRYKPFALKLEGLIRKEEGRIKNFSFMVLKNKFFALLVTIFIIVVFFIEIPYFVGFFDRVIPTKWVDLEQTIFWLTVPIVVLFVVGFGFIIFGDFITWLNKFSNGHAIGALGVVITFLGLIGDAYQSITILTN